MKMLLLIYDAVFEDEVMEALENGSRLGYTQWRRVLGRGEKAEPRLDDGVWPGFNNALMIAVADDRAEELAARLKGLRDSGKVTGLSLYAMPMEQMI
jgi:nitrogen regulatory protein PII